MSFIRLLNNKKSRNAMLSEILFCTTLATWVAGCVYNQHKMNGYPQIHPDKVEAFVDQRLYHQHKIQPRNVPS